MSETIPRLICGDAIAALETLPAQSVDLVLTDPPYNIGKADWDRIPGYIDWCASWLQACARALKPSGVLYLWHNNLPAIAQLMDRIRTDGLFTFRSFCVWDKGAGYHTFCWKRRDPLGATAPRSWFNRCEYCLHYFLASDVNAARGARAYHRCDADHHNVWSRPPLPGARKKHPCEKPVDLLRRIIRVSCPPGGVVLDCFMGSGSCGEAAAMEARGFVGIERDEAYFANAKRRILAAYAAQKQACAE